MGPIRIVVPGTQKQVQGPIVFRVLEKDELGRPKVVELGLDDEKVFDLEDGKPREFFTGFLAVEAFHVETKGTA